jgi:RNA polymerase sigma factor (sigma-70 family)
VGWGRFAGVEPVNGVFQPAQLTCPPNFRHIPCNLFSGARYTSMKRQITGATNSPMTDLLSDEELMLQVRNGIGEMLGVLFDRYQVPLFNFYCKLTGNRTASEDLVQEVFFRILKYRQSYRPGTSFRPWVYRIARNARTDYSRRQHPEVSWEQEMEPAIMPADSVQSRQQAELLQRALMHLPEEKKEVLILSRFQGLKYEEIAELLGCEVGTVKTRVHRALQDLREIFQEFERHSSAGKNPVTRPCPAPGV